MTSRWLPLALVAITMVLALPLSSASGAITPPRVIISIQVICSNGLAYLAQSARNVDSSTVHVRFGATAEVADSSTLRLRSGQVRYLLRPTGSSAVAAGTVHTSIAKSSEGQRIPGDDVQGYAAQNCAG